jgi:hypothetical protein
MGQDSPLKLSVVLQVKLALTVESRVSGSLRAEVGNLAAARAQSVSTAATVSA